MGWQDAPLVEQPTAPAPPAPKARWEEAPIVQDATPAPRAAVGALEHVQAGWQGSAPGLAWRGRMPDLVMDPETAKWWERAATGFSHVGAELPLMIGGAMAGGTAGAPAGPVGSLLGAGFGMGVVPATIRQSLIEAYKSGEIKTVADWFNAVRSVATVAVKEGGINAAAMGAGGLAKAGLAAAGGANAATSKAIGVGTATPITRRAAIGSEAADLATQIAAMVTMPAALEQRMPGWQEFMDAAILVGGMKAAHVTATRMMSTYQKTGKTPAEQVEDAKADPKVAEDLAAGEQGGVDPITGTTSGVPIKLDRLIAEAELLGRGGVDEAPKVRDLIREALVPKGTETSSGVPIQFDALIAAAEQLGRGGVPEAPKVADIIKEIKARGPWQGELLGEASDLVADTIRLSDLQKRAAGEPARTEVTPEGRVEVPAKAPEPLKPAEQVELDGLRTKIASLEARVRQMPTAEEREASAGRVHDDVLRQIREADQAREAAGLTPLGEDHAVAVAALVRARVRTRAERMGQLPEDIYRDRPLQIRDEAAAEVHREADGFDARQAAVLDAQLNIREEQGSVADYVQYFKDSGITREAADERGLLARAKGRAAFSIARDASPDLAAAHRAGVLSDEAALSISQTAPGSERLQALGMTMVQDGKSILIAVNTMRAFDVMAAERQAGGAQGDIFGFDDSAIAEASAMAKRASSIQRKLGEQIAAVSGAAKRPEIARKMGVDVQDPEGVQKRIVALRQEQFLWDNWPLHPELVARLRAPDVTGREGELRQDAVVPNPETPAEATARDAEAAAQSMRRIEQQRAADLAEREFRGPATYVTRDDGSPLLHHRNTAVVEPKVWDRQSDGGISYEHVVEIGGKDLGLLSLTWKDGVVTQLHNIRTYGGMGQGFGTDMLRAILTHNPPESTLWLRNVTEEARPWWERRGAKFFETEAGEDGTLTRVDFEAANPLKRGDRQDARGAGEEAAAEGLDLGRIEGPGTADGAREAAVEQTFLEGLGPLENPNHLFQSTTLREGGRETLRKYGLNPDEKHTTRQVAAALEARQRERWGTIAPNDRSPEAASKIARWMTEEITFETQHPERSGVGWYGEKFQRAIDIMGDEFPELKTDKNARDLMTLFVALASDGQKVVPNFAMAADIYSGFRQSGTFATARGHARIASIEKNLERVQELHEKLGPDGMRDYLMQEFSISQLNQLAKAAGLEMKTDYQAHVKMPMAALVLGPKLGAFYANLMGSHGYLTMDRWWSRTFNRYRGTLITAPTRQGLDRFKELLGKPELSDDQAISETVPFQKAYEAKGFKEGTEIEKAANTIHKAAFTAIEDAPFNASDRTFMLAAVKQARTNLRRRGIIMSTADIQAVLWYYEKRLYGDLGARQSADISYEGAARQVIGARGGEPGRPAAEGRGEPAARRAAEEHPPGEESFLDWEAEGGRLAGKGPSPETLLQEHRGSYQVAENLVTIMQGADKSTVVHELGHSWLEEMRTDAANPRAPAQIRADWDILRRELAIGSDGKISRQSHEQFARSVERYLAEGEAPSPGLRSVFERFKSWLLEIYQSVANLNVNINPDLRAVLDRMLATDQEIADARALGVPRAYVAEAKAETARRIVPGFKAEQVAIEPYADELPKGPGEAPDNSHVNYDTVDAPVKIKLTLQRLAEIDQENVQKHRGGKDGVETWQQEQATMEKWILDTLGDGADRMRLMKGMDPNDPKTNHRLRAMKQMMVGAGHNSERMREVILEKGHNATIEEQLQYLSSIELVRQLHAEFLGERAAVARAMNALKDTREGSAAIESMLDAIGRGADSNELFQSAAEKAAADQAMLKAKLDEILLRYNGKTVLDIAKLHKEVGTLKGTFGLAKTIEKATTWEMLVEGWKSLGLLSGPVTHTTNLFGTEAFMSLRAPVDALAAMIGMARGASPGMGESNRASMSESVARLTGMLMGVKDGLKVAFHTFNLDEATVKTESFRTAIPGRLGEFIRIPYRLMGAADALNKTIYGRGELNTLSIRQAFDENLNPATREFAERVEQLRNQPTPEMAAEADSASRRMTFNAPLGEKGVALQLFVQKWNLQWMIPFISTPINVTKEVARMSPFAPLVGEWRADIVKGGVARDRALAEMALGSGLMAVTMAYAFSGDISGGGSPDPGKNRGKAGVEQPYSIRIGDTWYEYARIQPTGTLMGMAADIAVVWDHMTDEEKDKVPKLLARAFSNAVTNQTFLQGITNVVQAMSEPARFGPKFLEQLAGTAVPNVVGQPTAMADPVVREVNGMLEAIQARIPGLRQDLLPKRDWLGEPVPTKERVGLVGPVREQPISKDKVRTEAARLDISMAAAPKKTHLGKGTGKLGDVELTPEERNKFQQVGGEMAHRILTNVVNAPGYDEMPPLIQKRIFAKVLSASHRVAAVQALPPEKRVSYLQSITEKMTAELSPTEQ